MDGRTAHHTGYMGAILGNFILIDLIHKHYQCISGLCPKLRYFLMKTLHVMIYLDKFALDVYISNLI